MLLIWQKHNLTITLQRQQWGAVYSRLHYAAKKNYKNYFILPPDVSHHKIYSRGWVIYWQCPKYPVVPSCTWVMFFHIGIVAFPKYFYIIQIYYVSFYHIHSTYTFHGVLHLALSIPIPLSPGRHCCHRSFQNVASCTYQQVIYLPHRSCKYC